MRLNTKSLQFLANLLAVEVWFDGPLPARLRNALAMRDLTGVKENTRVQMPNQLRTFGYLSDAPESHLAERGFRTFVTDKGKAAVEKSETKSNLTEDEIEANVRAFGFEPMDGKKNAKIACTQYSPDAWISPGAAVARDPADEPASPIPESVARPAMSELERAELLEDLRAEHAKESQDLETVRGRIAEIRANVLPLRRQARFLETLFARYASYAEKLGAGARRDGLARERDRVRGELDAVKARLETLNDTELSALEDRASVLVLMVDAIIEAIAANAEPQPDPARAP